MTQMSLSDLAEKMRGIDIAVLSTKTAPGEIASRPMSNNGDVARGVSGVRQEGKFATGRAFRPGDQVSDHAFPRMLACVVGSCTTLGGKCLILEHVEKGR